MPPANHHFLERLRATGRADTALEAEMGLPLGFMYKLNKGMHRTSRNEDSFLKIEAFLGIEKPVPLEIPASIQEEVLQADTLSKIKTVLTKLTGLVLEGQVPPRIADTITKLLTERRQTLKQESVEVTGNKDKEPLKILVQWDSDWRATGDKVDG
jgi:hypothetical protein